MRLWKISRFWVTRLFEYTLTPIPSMLFGTQAAIIYSRIFRFTVHVTFYGRIDLYRFSIAF